jgi:iron complex transport system substrate-binding protein
MLTGRWDPSWTCSRRPRIWPGAPTPFSTACARHWRRPAATGLRAYYARGKDGLETAVPGSVLAEGIEFCGLSLAAPSSSGGEHAKLSVEEIAHLDPDIVVTSNRALFATISTSAQWSGVRAVREHRIYLSPSNPFGWVDSPPGINRLIGVRWLAGRLHPSARRSSRGHAQLLCSVFSHRSQRVATRSTAEHCVYAAAMMK